VEDVVVRACEDGRARVDVRAKAYDDRRARTCIKQGECKTRWEARK